MFDSSNPPYRDDLTVEEAPPQSFYVTKALSLSLVGDFEVIKLRELVKGLSDFPRSV